jgi:heme exporter protein B
MMRVFWAIIVRDIRLSMRSGGHFWASLLFFTLIVLLLPFALGPDLKALRRIGPGLLWIATLLTTVIGASSLFVDDRDDGSLSFICASALPLSAIVLAKGLGHWATTGLPLALLAPFLGIFLSLPFQSIALLALALFVGTFALAFIGLMGAALTFRALNQNAVLAPLITLPFSIPTLIFGVCVSQEATGSVLPGLTSQALLLLCATSCIMFFTGLGVGVYLLKDQGT